jgi:ABC-type antimicrobial peptide transport system permease subunit
MSSWQFIRRSLAHHWRVHLAVALGVVAGTAVLTGALLVGDSVRGSLRGLTLDRLGKIDHALVTPAFFRHELPIELASAPRFQEHFDAALPAIILRASMANPQRAADGGGNVRQEDAEPQAAQKVRGFSGRVTLLAVENSFWDVGEGRPAVLPKEHAETDEIVLNQPLAEELGVAIGDVVLLRLPEISRVPRESTLGRKRDFVQGQQFKVVDIVPAEGLGRFGLQPNQQLPFNAYATLRSVQQMLDHEGRANSILVTGRHEPSVMPPPQSEDLLKEILSPHLADYGLTLELVKHEKAPYFQLTTERMLLANAAEQAALDAFVPLGGQPALTYLANYIAVGPRLSDEQLGKMKPDDKWPNAIPYSTVTALDFGDADQQARLGRWKSTLDGKEDVVPTLGDNEIALNAWAFDDLNEQLKANGHPPLKRGDEIRLTYFEPEHTEGRSVEQTTAFKLRAVFPLDADSPANDRHFTPDVPGVTDKASIENWDPPFEPYYQDRIRRADDDYWKKYHATPKAFVSLKTGQELWGTRRFGQLSSVRVPAGEGRTAESLAKALENRIRPADLGFAFQPVKRQGLEAATGTTPFSVLFLAFSFFIIAAAVMLVALLFRLGVEGRASEVGTLLAEGLTRRQMRRLLATEGLIVAAIGGLAGTLAGTGYAALMLYGLRTWWVKAVATPFLQLHVSWPSFVVGYLSGVIVCFVAIWWTLFRMRRVPLRRLLAGQATEDTSLAAGYSRISIWIAAISLAVAVVFVGVALTQGAEAQAGAFFGSGFALLVACMACLWTLLGRGATGAAVSAGAMPLLRLAARNGARHPSRSTLTIALVAAAAFLIFALSVFQSDASQLTPRRESGNGGFALVAESGAPIVVDLNDTSRITGLQEEDRKKLAGVTIHSFRVQPGEDASCRNLYQATRPRVLGVPSEFVRRGGFAWAGTAAAEADERENPWLLLERDAGRTESGEPYVPIVLDANTAMYSLHIYSVGETLTIQDDWGRDVPLKVVGMLKNSIFQGDVLMSEENFLSRFPEVSGSSFFLVEIPEREGEAPAEPLAKRIEQTQRILESALNTAGGEGFDAETTSQRLRDFLAVQDTYLSTFQSLGALGLLLGTFGLATVQLRNVLERRGELALLRAAGFPRRRLAMLVLSEHSLLLASGLIIGLLAALVAVLPHFLVGDARAQPELFISMLIIFAVGLVAGLAAVIATLRAPLIQALRGE